MKNNIKKMKKIKSKSNRRGYRKITSTNKKQEKPKNNKVNLNSKNDLQISPRKNIHKQVSIREAIKKEENREQTAQATAKVQRKIK